MVNSALYFCAQSHGPALLGRREVRQQQARNRLSVRSAQDNQAPRNRDQERSPKTTSRRDLMKSGATLGFGGAAARWSISAL